MEPNSKTKIDPELKEQVLQLLRSDDGKEIIRFIAETIQIEANSEGTEFLLGTHPNEKTENDDP